MLTALGIVILTSFSGVMMPGPMFAVTLAKSLKSPWVGLKMSLGHAVVEVPLIFLVYFGLVHFLEKEIVQLVLGVLGGGMIIWMGINLFRARRTISNRGKDTGNSAFKAGILMTGLNPFFLVWWVTVGSLLLMTFLNAVGTWGLPLFITVHLLCDFIWLSLVSVIIYRTRGFWDQSVQEWVYIIMSLALLFFGTQFIVKGILNYL